MGVLFYELLTFTCPFKGYNMLFLSKMIEGGRYDPIPSSYSPIFSELLSHMLIVQPNRRYTAKQLLEYLYLQ